MSETRAITEAQIQKIICIIGAKDTPKRDQKYFYYSKKYSKKFKKFKNNLNCFKTIPFFCKFLIVIESKTIYFEE